MPQRNRELARIHLLAKQLGLTREQYEAVLWAQQAGCDSAADLDEHGRRKVIEQLEARLAAGRTVEGTPPRNMDRPLMRKIRAQLAEGGKPWAYAAGTAKKLCGKSNLDWCSDDELSRVVAALAISAKRRHDRGGDAS
jgi:hypothetical protein